MLETDKVFAGSVPENYDRFMVPLIFEPYARDMAARIAALAPSHVLETAAGSGVVTRAVAPHLPAGATYIVTDLNQPMLDYAASRQPPDKRIAWRQADALALPFKNGAFDVVCCQFGAMFFPDRAAGYREARRVLQGGGRYLFSVWDEIGQNVFANDVTSALADLFPDDPPRFLARTPHGYHDVDVIRADLERAGFSDIGIDTLEAPSRAPSAQVVAFAYCQGTPVRNEIEARAPGRLELVTQHVAARLSQLHGEGEVSAQIQAHVITAIA